MKFKLIKTEEEYNNAVAYLEELGDREDFQTNESLVDEFELISKLVSIYDKEHYPIEPANPIDTILLKMGYMGLKRKDLSHIASSGVLSEVFNGKRALSKQMIRMFSELLNIDQSLLNAKHVRRESEEVIPETQERDMKVETANSSVRIPKPRLAKPESPFKFLKRNKPKLVAFKARVAEECMLLNIKCAV